MSPSPPDTVLLVLHGWPAETMGGTGLYVAALADALRQAGTRTLCVAPRQVPGLPAPRLRPAEGVRDAWLVEQPPPTRFVEGWRRPRTDALLAELIHRQGVDLVHVHHLADASLGWLRAARSGGVGLVLTLHDYNLPCARGQLVDRDLQPCPGPGPARCASCLGEHLRMSPLTQALAAAARRSPGLARRGRRQLARPDAASRARVADRLAAVRASLRLPHRLLSPSHDLADRFATLGLRRPEHMPLPLLRPLAPASEPPAGPLRLLFASSVIPTKGPQRLLAAFRHLPVGSATLTIAGPTPHFDGHPGFADRLRTEVDDTPGARWAGYVPPAGLQALLAEHDVLVLPSLWPENSPLIVREAAAVGLRLVVSAEGGAGELAPAARRVDPRDDDALAAALRDEIRRGRGRVPPLRWDSPADHARRMLAEVYRPVRASLTG